RRKFANAFRLCEPRSRNEFHHAKLSLIAKYQTSIVVEIEDRVGVLRQFLLGRQVKKLAGHAQMDGEDALGIKLDQNELAPTRDAGNTGTLEFALEDCG